MSSSSTTWIRDGTLRFIPEVGTPVVPGTEITVTVNRFQ